MDAAGGGTADKLAMYAEFARVGQVLGNPLRLQLLDLLAQAERSVEDLATVAAATVGNTSAQLRALREAGLVVTRREGNRVYYRLVGPDVLDLLATLTRVADTRAAGAERAVRAYLGDTAGLEAIDRDELAARLRDGATVVLDVRPRAEYDAGHIPRARSMPLDELAARVDDLPADAQIVAYCRGPYCVYAPEAARLLRAAGRDARLLPGGWADWALAGLPVETAAA
ncbi:ArsR family transcriptional regulator [Actinomycetospora lemnae]|uniref:ArsR family transcriptional regulator n=1 Tax=Actinomycetospora lemnae TaxID=3019891 RepID=A0ABT5SY77_9PSEU|nr:ArsR family transcriptional regulator [Actinomycetospora sp. DW7H6]MDD7967813.1 ArsR family transcriptional regulator [Actinomycetospora sp. DW7H6]